MDYYLSKTDFKIGSSCSRKLWYKKQGYPSVNDENEYLQYLAKGGYIVGKMAQLIYDGGIDLSSINDPDEVVKQTKALLTAHDNIILYEAAVYSKNKLARIDILEKKGSEVRIIEVKAKSQNTEQDSDTIPDEYLNDVLFQVVTMKEAYPEYNVKGYLFLPDKSKLNQIEGLTGWFLVEEEQIQYPELDELPARSSSRFYVPKVRFKYDQDPERNKYLDLLRQYSIMEIRDIEQMDFKGDWSVAMTMVTRSFESLYESVLKGVKVPISKQCKSCEYASDEEGKNGFKQCWKELEGQDLSALDLFYGGAIQQGKGQYYLNELIERKKLSLQDIEKQVITKGKKPDELSSRALRQLMQIEAAKTGKEQFNKEVLQEALESWRYPLFFIDFETYTGAIPFHRNMRPYELIAFQWSCHQLNQDGTMQHHEWINMEMDFPNFRFAESLREVVGDKGTPLMWSNHGNTVLRHILQQMLIHSYNHPMLEDWLTNMTHDRKAKKEGRLVDMAKLCEQSYVHPHCKGKVSIKKILPAIWKSEHNSALHGHQWFKDYFKRGVKGEILDPYQTLDVAEEFLVEAEGEAEEVVAEGTAAMRAYFEIMYGKGRGREHKKKELAQLLLQYCKLDTLAMVIIYEYWKKLIR